MSETETLQEEIAPWVRESLEEEDIKDFEVVVTGKPEKGEGYLGDVIFVKVTGVTKSSNENTELDLVVKMGKKNKLLREKMPVRDISWREIVVYENILPEFRKFQKEKGVQDIFNAVPKCYKTIFLEDAEVVVLENLTARGFEMHDRQITMNDAHIKLVLRTYAKFHAISFAMRDQNPEDFEELMTDYDCMPKRLILTEGSIKFNNSKLKKVLKLIRENDGDMADLLSKKLEDGYAGVMDRILSDAVKECVVTHLECWNNNFMFKYETENKETPAEISILDWQLSSLHSPVLDLSYFLYIVSGEEELARFDEFLRFYYARLSECLIEMGSDPQKMFPFATLMNHWKKYSAYGMMYVLTFLDMSLSDKDEALSLDNVDENADPGDFLKIKPKNPENYKKRLLAAVRHFLFVD